MRESGVHLDVATSPLRLLNDSTARIEAVAQQPSWVETRARPRRDRTVVRIVEQRLMSSLAASTARPSCLRGCAARGHDNTRPGRNSCLAAPHTHSGGRTKTDTFERQDLNSKGARGCQWRPAATEQDYSEHRRSALLVSWPPRRSDCALGALASHPSVAQP